jgi:hypothetical protein
MADWYRQRGRDLDAVESLNRAHQLATALVAVWPRYGSLALVAHALAEHEQPEAAAHLADQAQDDDLMECGDPQLVCRVLARLAVVQSLCGDRDEAERLLAEAQERAAHMGGNAVLHNELRELQADCRRVLGS